MKQIQVEEFEWDLIDKRVKIKLCSDIDQEVLVDAPLFPQFEIASFTACETCQERDQWKLKLNANQTATIHINL